ncbi:MAG: stage II sporulation protein R [Clostridia bacterium]|nr:stage II sporulation protein R [Clostridia bacterium]
MKKFCILFLGLFIIILTAIGSGVDSPQVRADYLRVHIRANSNAEIDQTVKYLVRDAVVEAVTPWIVHCATKQEAIRVMENRLTELIDVSEKVLQKHGFSYGVRAGVRKETFPTRVYEEYTLESGVYDALIIELGEGKGDNWWCCIYPPLCFTAVNGQNVVYRSKIMQMIEEFFNP